LPLASFFPCQLCQTVHLFILDERRTASGHRTLSINLFCKW
jgi:hypothetical protein